MGSSLSDTTADMNVAVAFLKMYREMVAQHEHTELLTEIRLCGFLIEARVGDNCGCGLAQRRTSRGHQEAVQVQTKGERHIF